MSAIDRKYFVHSLWDETQSKKLDWVKGEDGWYHTLGILPVVSINEETNEMVVDIAFNHKIHITMLYEDVDWSAFDFLKKLVVLQAIDNSRALYLIGAHIYHIRALRGEKGGK